jgi:VWFA-related protein
MRHPHRASALAGIAALVAASAASPQTPSFPAARELVRVDVAVTDDHGAAVQGLTAADFTVLSDGKPVGIATFEAVVVRAPEREEPGELVQVSEALPAHPEETRAFLFFFDDVHLSPPGAEAARRALEPVLARQVRPGDWVTVMSASGLKWTARTAAELRLLPRVLPALSASRQIHTTSGHIVSANAMTDYQAMMIARFGRYHSGVAPPDAKDARGAAHGEDRGEGDARLQAGPDGRRAVLGDPGAAGGGGAALCRRAASRGPQPGRPEGGDRLLRGFRGRKSAFVYSEGFIKSPDLGDYDAVAALARRTRTALYTIDPRRLSSGVQTVEGQPGHGRPHHDRRRAGRDGGQRLRGARDGGRASRATDPTTLFREVAQEVSAYYLIGFDPPSGSAASASSRSRRSARARGSTRSNGTSRARRTRSRPPRRWRRPWRPCSTPPT